ncbi:ABC transporter ATP-binding protein [Parcubacteria bacterium DG_72]|nr:MAG: ABC transporter ATP-binding protein [Parcubacteria bacterium DG_72]
MLEEIIKLENIWKTYLLGKVKLTVLKGVDLVVKKGSFVAIMGPSGSGKSTLLHMVGALDIPSKGKVYIDGEDISSLPEDELAKIRGKKIGFVFQQFNLLHNLTALENVMLPMVFQGVSEKQRTERAKELLSSIGLEERVYHRPAELSGGERQRIAIARSLANDPEVIVADEPTGNLDSSTGKKIMDILIDLHTKDKKTIIVVTHDPNIASYTEETINIMDGEVVKDGVLASKYLWKKKND